MKCCLNEHQDNFLSITILFKILRPIALESRSLGGRHHIEIVDIYESWWIMVNLKFESLWIVVSLLSIKYIIEFIWIFLNHIESEWVLNLVFTSWAEVYFLNKQKIEKIEMFNRSKDANHLFPFAQAIASKLKCVPEFSYVYLWY